jgi:hypothetical protein
LYEQEIDVLNSDQFQKIQNNKTNEIYNKIQEIVSKFSLDLEKESNPPPKEEEIPKETPKETVAPVQEKIPEKKKKVKKNKITAKRITSILDNYENFVKQKIEKETNIAKEFLQKKNKDCKNLFLIPQAAAVAVERQKIYKNQLENSPRSFIENLTDTDAPEMYLKLKKYFGVFQLTIEQFDPKAQLIGLTTSVFLQILDKYEASLIELKEEQMRIASDFIKQQNKPGNPLILLNLQLRQNAWKRNVCMRKNWKIFQKNKLNLFLKKI